MRMVVFLFYKGPFLCFEILHAIIGILPQAAP